MKTQRVIFENQEKTQQIEYLLVMAQGMKILPLYYQVLFYENRIYLSEKKWKEWKLCGSRASQQKFLHRNVRLYEPGNTNHLVDQEFPRILDSLNAPA